MGCELPILREDFDGTERAGTLIWFLSGTLTAAFSVFLLFIVGPFAMILAMGIGILFSNRWMHSALSDWASKKDFIGKVVLGNTIETNIEGVRRTITLAQGDRVRLETHHKQGKPRVWKDVIHNGVGTLTIYDGTTPTTIKFLVRNKGEMNELVEVLRSWYRAGYQVVETFGGPSLSVFLMRDNWPYDELRSAKSELGLVGGMSRER